MDICCWPHTPRHFKSSGMNQHILCGHNWHARWTKAAKVLLDLHALNGSRKIYAWGAFIPIAAGPGENDCCRDLSFVSSVHTLSSASAVWQPGLSPLRKPLLWKTCSTERSVSTNTSPDAWAAHLLNPPDVTGAFFSPSTCCPWACNVCRTGHPPLLSTDWKKSYTSCSQRQIFFSCPEPSAHSKIQGQTQYSVSAF